MDNANFNSIYTAFYRKSFIYVKSYVHDEFVAEDIVIESFVKLWTILKQDHNVNIAPFLFTLLKNGAFDYLKHEKTKLSAHATINQLLKRELEIRLSSLNASDPEEIFSTEVSLIINRTLATLPKRTRHIFEMSRFEGKPYKKIAEKYGITVKGVDYHIFQALSALRVSLKDYLPAWLLVYIFL
jgi:RNA polymerase sigma-70 factor, ECF subfamily